MSTSADNTTQIKRISFINFIKAEILDQVNEYNHKYYFIKFIDKTIA